MYIVNLYFILHSSFSLTKQCDFQCKNVFEKHSGPIFFVEYHINLQNDI